MVREKMKYLVETPEGWLFCSDKKHLVEEHFFDRLDIKLPEKIKVKNKTEVKGGYKIWKQNISEIPEYWEIPFLDLDTYEKMKKEIN